MKLNTLLLAATVVTLAAFPAAAQPNSAERAYDRGYAQSQNDRGYNDRGYEERRGQRQMNNGYYRQGAYEQDCRRGNAAAGTIFGALAGGLVGSAASNGNGGAVVGGAVLGGLLGNTIARDIDCDAQPRAFRTYSTGLNGNLGRRYEWRSGNSRGHFTPIREYRRDGSVCRDFTETSWRNGRSVTRTGTSCRARDGNWRFD
jgi:surface antigen